MEEFRRKAREQGIDPRAVESVIRKIQQRRSDALGVENQQLTVDTKELNLKQAQEDAERERIEREEGDPEENLAADSASGNFTVPQLFAKYGTDIEPNTILAIYNQQQSVAGGFGPATESDEFFESVGVKTAKTTPDPIIKENKKNTQAFVVEMQEDLQEAIDKDKNADLRQLGQKWLDGNRPFFEALGVDEAVLQKIVDSFPGEEQQQQGSNPLGFLSQQNQQNFGRSVSGGIGNILSSALAFIRSNILRFILAAKLSVISLPKTSSSFSN